MIPARVTTALIHRERDELDAAVDVLAPHLDAALREGHVAMTTLGEIELARVECARGRAEDAIARVLRVRRDREGRGLPVFLAGVLDRAECRVRLQAGDVDRADDLLQDLEPGPERDLLAARVALALGRLDAAEALLSGVRATTGDNRRLSLEAAALTARACAESGDVSGARRVLADVAAVARREGALRTFIDEGWDVREVADGGVTPIASASCRCCATCRAASRTARSAPSCTSRSTR
jgi:ATP/maltotriose-dependent transcriptional regulator MalT